MDSGIDLDLCKKFHFEISSESENDSDDDGKLEKSYEIFLRNMPPPLEISEMCLQSQFQSTGSPISPVLGNLCTTGGTVSDSINKKPRKAREQQNLQNKSKRNMTQKFKSSNKNDKTPSKTSNYRNRFHVFQDDEILDEDINTINKVEETRVVTDKTSRKKIKKQRYKKSQKQKNEKSNNEIPLKNGPTPVEMKTSKKTELTKTSKPKPATKPNVYENPFDDTDKNWPEIDTCLAMLIVHKENPIKFKEVIESIIQSYIIKANMNLITKKNSLHIIARLVNTAFAFLLQDKMIQSFDEYHGRKIPVLKNLKAYNDKGTGIVKFRAPVQCRGFYFRNFSNDCKIYYLLNLTHHQKLSQDQIMLVVCASIIDTANKAGECISLQV